MKLWVQIMPWPKKNKCKFLMKVFEKYAPDKTDRLLI